MQRYILSFVLLVFSAALQGAWPPWLRLCGQPPDLVLATVVCIGLSRGATEGCLAGLIAATLWAGVSHTPIGGLCVGFMVVGACAGFLRGTLLADRVEVALAVSAIAVVVSGFLRMIFVPPAVFLVWFQGLMSAALLTAIAAPLVLWLTRLTRISDPGI